LAEKITFTRKKTKKSGGRKKGGKRTITICAKNKNREPGLFRIGEGENGNGAPPGGGEVKLGPAEETPPVLNHG